MSETKRNLEEISFQIISYSGEARSISIEAISEMKTNNNLNKANELLKEAEKLMIEAEKQHMNLVVDEAKGIKTTPTILLVHAEDQLLTTQTLMQLAKEMIDMYVIINELKKGK